MFSWLALHLALMFHALVILVSSLSFGGCSGRLGRGQERVFVDRDESNVGTFEQEIVTCLLSTI